MNSHICYHQFLCYLTKQCSRSIAISQSFQKGDWSSILLFIHISLDWHIFYPILHKGMCLQDMKLCSLLLIRVFWGCPYLNIGLIISIYIIRREQHPHIFFGRLAHFWIKKIRKTVRNLHKIFKGVFGKPLFVQWSTIQTTFKNNGNVIYTTCSRWI